MTALAGSVLGLLTACSVALAGSSARQTPSPQVTGVTIAGSRIVVANPDFTFLAPTEPGWGFSDQPKMLRLPKSTSPGDPQQLPLVMAFGKTVPQQDPKRGPRTVAATMSIEAISPNDRHQTAQPSRRQTLLNDLIQSSEPSRGQEIDGRDRLVSITVVVDNSPGSDCARVDDVVIERSVRGFVGRKFMAATHRYECLDPSGRFLIVLLYGERVPDGVASIDITAEGEAFLHSLRFGKQ